MSKFAVYRFNEHNYLYINACRDDDRYLAGEVINGLWNIIFDKKEGKVYAASNVKQCTPENFISDAVLTGEVVYRKSDYRQWQTEKYGNMGDTLGSDYNGVIEWAKSVLTESEK